MDVSLAGEISCHHSGACPHRAADQGALASTCECANQGSSASSTAYPSPVALLVVATGPPGRGRAHTCCSPVHGNGLECKLQPCSSLQSSRLVCINYDPFRIGTLGNDCFSIDDHGLRNRSFEMIPWSALVTRDCLVQSHMDWSTFWYGHFLHL